MISARASETKRSGKKSRLPIITPMVGLLSVLVIHMELVQPQG